MTDVVHQLALQKDKIDRLAGQMAERIVEDALKSAGGGGSYTGMEERVAKLETHFEYVRRDLDEIKADQKTIIAALTALPTKRDLTTNILVMVAIGLSVLAITVGGVVGGLAWLDRPAADEPWAGVPIVAVEPKT